VKERPILFNGEMVRAVLDGRKTQTRRVCIPRFDDRKPCEHYSPIGNGGVITNQMMRHCEHGSEGQPCPYGEVGDRLWVRETWKPCFDDGIGTEYRADKRGCCGPWKPSRFMPRNRSRITLEITGIRVERVQDITEADAKAEGINYGCDSVDWFQELWNSINAKRGFGWDANPWVWVVEFRKTEECK
jgi:hypothetical protein